MSSLQGAGWPGRPYVWNTYLANDFGSSLTWIFLYKLKLLLFSSSSRFTSLTTSKTKTKKKKKGKNAIIHKKWVHVMVWFLVRYLNNHLMNLFAGAWETRDVSPLPVDIPQATDNQVRPLLILKVWRYSHNLAEFFSISRTHIVQYKDDYTGVYMVCCPFFLSIQIRFNIA